MITTRNKKILSHQFCPLLSDCLLSTIESTSESESFRLFCDSIQIQENITFLKEAYLFKVALKDFKKNWRVAGITLLFLLALCSLLGKKEETFHLANRLWDNYFGPDAPFPVNIDVCRLDLFLLVADPYFYY
jgi:hypothetical protein